STSRPVAGMGGSAGWLVGSGSGGGSTGGGSAAAGTPARSTTATAVAISRYRPPIGSVSHASSALPVGVVLGPADRHERGAAIGLLEDAHLELLLLLGAQHDGRVLLWLLDLAERPLLQLRVRPLHTACGHGAEPLALPCLRGLQRGALLQGRRQLALDALLLLDQGGDFGVGLLLDLLLAHTTRATASGGQARVVPDHVEVPRERCVQTGIVREQERLIVADQSVTG